MKKFDTNTMTLIAILGAIIIVLGITRIGLIPLGFISITLLHIPVIIGAIVEGPFVGFAVGLIFGVYSLINAIINVSPVSFVFINPIVSVFPRIMIGIVASYSYILLKNKFKNKNIAVGISAFLGSITNTILVLSLIYILYAESYVKALGISPNVAAATIFGTVITNGVPEAIVSVLLTVPIVGILLRRRKNSL